MNYCVLSLLLFLFSCGGNPANLNTTSHQVQYWFKGDIEQFSYTTGSIIITLHKSEIDIPHLSADNQPLISTFVTIGEVFIQVTNTNSETAKSYVAVSIDGLLQSFGTDVIGKNEIFTKTIMIR